jgi:hypothetical protein
MPRVLIAPLVSEQILTVRRDPSARQQLYLPGV